MNLMVIDEDQIRRNIIIELCRPYDDGVANQTTNISLVDLQHAERTKIIFLHWNNYEGTADLAGVTKEVILYTGGGFRDLSDAEQNSGKVYKIHRSIDRNAPFDDHLKQGFIEILEYFKNGKQGQLPLLLVKTLYPDALIAYYLAMVAKKPALIEELKEEAGKYYEQLRAKHGLVERTLDEKGIKELFTTMAGIRP